MAVTDGVKIGMAAATAGMVTLISCGRPVRGANVVVVHRRTQAPLPDGYVGELWFASASVARGYLDHPDGTAECFYQALNGSALTWYGLGDLGFVLDDDVSVCGPIRR